MNSLLQLLLLIFAVNYWTNKNWIQLLLELIEIETLFPRLKNYRFKFGVESDAAEFMLFVSPELFTAP